MVDAYSKKIWTQCMNTDTTTSKTLAVLYGWFCSETGSPTTLVSDNGPQFTAHEFKDKMTKWGVKHVFSPPYHPASKGAAERAIQLFKDRLKKMNIRSKPVELYVTLAYIGKVHGLTPHASTDRCPFELVKQGNLPSLFPTLTSDVQKQAEFRTVRHSAAKLRNNRNFDEGDKVVVYDNHKKLSYPAVVSEILGTNNYLVNSDNGPKNVSGDVLLQVSETATAVPAADIDKNHPEAVTVEDDNVSVSSDISEDLDDLYAPHIVGGDNNVQRHRHGQREIVNLGSVPQNLSGLRSGRI